MHKDFICWNWSTRRMWKTWIILQIWFLLLLFFFCPWGLLCYSFPSKKCRKFGYQCCEELPMSIDSRFDYLVHLYIYFLILQGASGISWIQCKSAMTRSKISAIKLVKVLCGIVLISLMVAWTLVLNIWPINIFDNLSNSFDIRWYEPS